MTYEIPRTGKPLQAAAGNLFDAAHTELTAEEFLPLLQSETTCIERIVSHGTASPPGFWFDQPDDEWVMVVSGKAELAFEDGRQLVMQAGDWITIPAHSRHRVESTTADTIWLAVHIRRLPATFSCA